MVSEMALHILLNEPSIPETVLDMEEPQADMVEHWQSELSRRDTHFNLAYLSRLVAKL